MRVYLGSDHAGFELKTRIIEWLAAAGHEPVDCGPETYVTDDDFPPYVMSAARGVISDPGSLGVVIERLCLRPLRNVKGPAAMITTIGVSYVLFNVVLLTVGADSKNFPNPLPQIRYHIGEATLDFRVILIWLVALGLMMTLYFFVQRSRIGKAMRATAQDAEAARMMGVEVDKVIVMAFFLGSALAGAGGMIFGLYYNFTSFIIVFTAGLRAFTAAVLGGIGNVPGAMVGGVLIGLIEAMSSQFIAAAWADVIIFSILVLVLVFKPAGLFGRVAPNKS